MTVAGDGVRLAVGLLTVAPVRPPEQVDSVRARVAMLLAPVVGAALGTAGALVLGGAYAWSGQPLLAAVLGLATVGVLSGGLHLDGLVDVGDGLASRRTGAAALAVMRTPEAGALGVALLVGVLAVQAAALAGAVGAGVGGGALVVAAVTGRLAATLGCLRGVPAAADTGLGAAVAGCVPRAAALLLPAGVALAYTWAPLAAAAVLAGVAAAGVLLLVCVRRFGGVTGDVLGACVEVATAAALVTLAG